MDDVSLPPGDDPTYEVRISGLVPQTVLQKLDDVEVASEELRTVVSGHFADQAALYGFLHRLRDLGLDVVEVRQVAAPTTTRAREQEP
jgi:hypothetical protein